GAAFEATALKVLGHLQDNNPADFRRRRDELKRAGVQVGALDEQLKKISKPLRDRSADRSLITDRQELRQDQTTLPKVARDLLRLFSEAGDLFERGEAPVRIVEIADEDIPKALRLNKEGVVIKAHDYCQPTRWDKDSLRWVPCTLFDRVANLYL